jgi:hypothetical protein
MKSNNNKALAIAALGLLVANSEVSAL